MNPQHPNYRAAYDLAMTGRPSSMTLVELHRSIGILTRRQNRVSWLAHRAERIRVLKATRGTRMAALAIEAAADEYEREVRARRAQRARRAKEHGR